MNNTQKTQINEAENIVNDKHNKEGEKPETA